MEKILSQLAGASNGGVDASQLASLLQGGVGGSLGLSAAEAAALLGTKAEEESLHEDVKMENIGLTYDVFVQNELPHTSHSLEWLPISHADPQHAGFEFNYFLLGTHVAEADDEGGQEQPATAKN